MSSKKIRAMCLASLFTATVCICTFISVPLPVGYFNLGDAAILISSYALNPVCAIISAVFGSVLADIFMGYALYIPATLVIKLCIALLSCMLLRAIRYRQRKRSLLSLLGVFVLSELFLPIGYFLYEFFLLGYGYGALAAVMGNALQAVCCSVLASFSVHMIKKRTDKAV